MLPQQLKFFSSSFHIPMAGIIYNQECAFLIVQMNKLGEKAVYLGLWGTFLLNKPLHNFEIVICLEYFG